MNLKKISLTQVYAVIYLDEEKNEEAIMGLAMPGIGIAPLITANGNALDLLKTQAQRAVADGAKDVRIVRFSAPIVVEQFEGPNL